MVSSPRNVIVAAVLAVGCTISVFVSKNTSPDIHNHDQRLRQESSSRELRSKSQAVFSNSDPRTVQLRTDSIQDAGQSSPVALATGGVSIPDASDPAQSDAVASFVWEDIDYNLKWQCGKYRCFFLSLRNLADGYLIWNKTPRGHRNDVQTYQNALMEYEFATKLESEFNIRHFLASPPFILDTPEHFVEQLSDDSKQRFIGADRVVVQPSATAPAGSTVFKCTSARLFNTLKYMVKNGSKGYEETLLKGMEDTILLIEAHPKLSHDFQFMIDLEGQVYHLDFDRILNNNSEVSRIKICLERSMGYIRTAMK